MGDIYPFLHIGRKLKTLGCDIIFMSNFRYRDNAEQEGFEFVALDDEAWFDYLNNVPESKRKLPALLKLYKDIIPATTEKELALIESKIESPENTIILAHSNDYMTSMMAKEKYNIPLHLCVLAPSFVHSIQFFESVCKNASLQVNQVRENVGLLPVQDWEQWVRGFNDVFAFWPQWFSCGKSNEVQEMENVGFPSVGHVDQNALQPEVTKFIDSEKKVVAISHGTSRPFRDNYFCDAIEACRNTGRKLLVITPFREYVPDNISEDKDVLVVDYCPFHELIPQIDLLIHHGGIGTVRESIASGTPQLIIGKGYDRPHNGRIVKGLTVGDWIAPNALSSETIKASIELILNSEDIASSCELHKEYMVEHQVENKFYSKILE